MSREELIEMLIQQGEKTAQVVATVKAKKDSWDKLHAELQEELTDAKNRNEGLEFALKERNAELERVTKTLESMISVADKRGNASVDDKSRAEELETRIASLHEGLQLQKRDYEDKLKELRQQVQNEQLNVRVAEQKIRDLQEQLNLANERAFEAESRLGRMQKAHATLVADRNRSQYSAKAAATAKAAANDEALAKDLEEIDMLGSELLNVDMDIELDFDLDEELAKSASPSPAPTAKSAAAPAAEKKPAAAPAASAAASKRDDNVKPPLPTTNKPLPPPTKVGPPSKAASAAPKAAAKKATVQWDELDDMLNSL
eukprot:TRINITY_DN6742_c0_g1_i1.p1 TRINITY_DN6742_c0_g1~~TRINITY_DN6742_c0_g1_i1.p1  ORF type:complete len:316 (-),score=99.78 TRINITY_DN6742_c0_g1_i1:19-966(-)